MKLRHAMVALLGCTLVAGCTEVAPPSDQAHSDVSAVFSNIAQTKTLDPHIAFSSEGTLYVRQAYDSLLEYEPGGITVQAALATEWKVSADSRTYTLTLRDGATFHDGSPVDAEAVRTSIERIQAINQGPANLARDIASVTAPDTRTVVFTLEQPDVFFPGILPKLPIVSKKAIDTHKTAADPWAKDWFATNEAGAGAYTLVSHTANEIRFKAYDKYWRPFEPGTPTSVTLRTDPDATTAVQLMCQGKVDMIGGIGPDQTDQAAACPGVKTIQQTQYGVRTVFFNQQTSGPPADVRVRKAIALAFDYQSYLDYFKGKAYPANGPLPANAGKLGTPYPDVARDLDQAKRLLAEAGYPDGKFTVSYLGIKGLAWAEFFGTLLQQNLQELGVTLKQTFVPWPQMVSLQSNPETAHDLALLSVNMVTNDPTAMLKSAYVTSAWADKGGSNWGYYSNEKVDDLTASVSTVQDENQRAEIIHEILGEIIADQVAVWLMRPSIYQPVLEKWDVKYEPMDNNVMVRFYFARLKS
ncbi:ABC transporter substrate-binding protein [Polymorphospora sp. NPDC051019]|uniref:ABC transporter substrate-binding protein n=1 Tax=Polymorphospora sp. NPDC051019 TaxID=3155725 RepID=UPI00343B62AD